MKKKKGAVGFAMGNLMIFACRSERLALGWPTIIFFYNNKFKTSKTLVGGLGGGALVAKTQKNEKIKLKEPLQMTRNRAS